VCAGEFSLHGHPHEFGERACDVVRILSDSVLSPLFPFLSHREGNSWLATHTTRVGRVNIKNYYTKNLQPEVVRDLAERLELFGTEATPVCRSVMTTIDSAGRAVPGPRPSVAAFKTSIDNHWTT
jgi:hypothetical protein